MTQENTPVVLNLFGGPHCGKSTIALGVAENLKWEHVKIDYAPEIVKSMVYEESFKALEHQMYVFGRQLHELWIRREECDVIVLDTSLLVSLIYHSVRTSHLFKALVLQEYHKFDNVNFFIERSDQTYDQSGRMQDEEEAAEVDQDIKRMLGREHIECQFLSGGRERTQTVTDTILSRLETRGML